MTTPIFILGVAPRCGTNYLEDLLCVHPDCGLGVPLRENHLVSVLPDMSKIMSTLEERWRGMPEWGFLPQHAADLTEAMGRAMIDFMVSQVDDRRRIDTPPDTLVGIDASFKQSPRFLVSKRPRTTGLAEFRRFFPDEKLILLMRDGRAVTESSIRSWGWRFDIAVQSWRRGAADIAAFLDAHPDDPALLVLYEDLVTHPEGELERIFSFLGLDPDPFDFERALNRPVRGSSTHRPSGAEGIDWHPVDKTDTFVPVARARHWTDPRHARFNHMAGDLSTRFGYTLVPTRGTPWSGAVNRGRDILLMGRNKLHYLLRRWAEPSRE